MNDFDSISVVSSFPAFFLIYFRGIENVIF